MNVVACQWDLIWEDKAANFARLRELLDSAQPEPGSLLVLPEMFATGFSMNLAATAEEPNGETTIFLADLAKHYQCAVLGGLVVRGTDGRGRNEALLFDARGKLLTRYAKLFPFKLGGETIPHTPGNRIVTAQLGDLVIAPFICYDLRFPEAFRLAARRGAQLITVIASWPEARIGHWVTLLQARAIENQAYVVGVNRCGTDPQFRYTGRSLIIAPSGEILADAGDTEGVITAKLDVDTLESYRRKLPFLADMRDDLLAEESEYSEAELIWTA